MFSALTRIATALEQLVVLKTQEVALSRANETLREQTVQLVTTANAVVEASNTRATWYHQESAKLQQQVAQLQAKVQRLEVFQ